MKTINFILFLFTIIFFQSCGDSGEPVDEKKVTTKEPVARQVLTTTVEAIEYTQTVFASGQLATKNELKLSFKTGGIIKNIYGNEGQHISKGKVLATLNLDEINAQVQQAELGVQQAEIKIDNAALGVRRANREYEAAKNLFRDSVATSEQLDDAEIQLNNARNQLSAAKTGLDFNVKNVDVAMFNLDHSKIIAPTNGVILKKLAQSNELIGPGNPVFIFGSKDQAQVIRVNIIDKDIIHINAGDKALIDFDAYPNQQFEGRVQEIAGIADPYTNTYQVEIALKNSGKKLLPGFIGRVEILTKTSQQLLQIPIDAMVSGDKDKAIVFITNDDKAARTSIEMHSIKGDKILVREGLEAGQQIIVSGAGYLKDGDLIKVQ